MKSWVPGVSLAIALAAGFGAVVRLAAWPLVRIHLPHPAASAADAEPRFQPRLEGSGDTPVEPLVARDPFRISRRPAAVAYDPLTVGQPEAPVPPKPALVLVGLVAGAEPSAVLEGLPGIEGARVMRVGDVVAGLTVTRIAGAAVWVRGMDTVWVLRVREPWR